MSKTGKHINFKRKYLHNNTVLGKSPNLVDETTKKQKILEKSGLMEIPRKTNVSPRVAQQQHVDQAFDWKCVTSNDDSIYVKPRAKANKTGHSRHEQTLPNKQFMT